MTEFLLPDWAGDVNIPIYRLGTDTEADGEYIKADIDLTEEEIAGLMVAYVKERRGNRYQGKDLIEMEFFLDYLQEQGINVRRVESA